MATEIKMPQLSDTMDAGKILSWNKNEGDKVSRGDILAEVETDKANLEIECFNEGYLVKIVVPAGESVAVGEAIAFVGEQNESVSSSSSDSKPEPTPSSASSEPESPSRSEEQVTSTEVQETPAASSVQTSSSERVKISPLAKKIADQNKVDVSNLQGSGPNGRIIRKDVELAVSGGNGSSSYVAKSATEQPPAPSSQPQAGGSSELAGTLTPLSKMRATIARRMQQAVVEAPHFYTTISVDMTEAVKLRGVFKQDPSLKDISINHLIIKAAGYALSKESGVNASVKNEQLFQPADINIGVITAVEGGLMIPVIRSVDRLGLNDLAFETRAAIERARAGRPSATDLSGGTFSISNMGMFGVESFTAIINPGQGAILAVGATLDKAAVKNGVIQSVPTMQVTLSVDHRIIDGTMSGNWLTYFKQALEQPAVVLL